MASERTSHLTPSSPNRFRREKKRERERKREEEEDFRERESTFSLDFPVTGPSNSGETRGKVDPHCKSYVWVPVL